MDGRRGGWGTRRAGGGAAWTNNEVGGGAKQKGESDGAVRIRTNGSRVEVIIMDEAEQRRRNRKPSEPAGREAAKTLLNGWKDM